jgi:AraC-like DNA-binding protein
MQFRFHNQDTKGWLNLTINESIEQNYQAEGGSTLTILWNRGDDQEIIIDQVPYTFPSNTICPIVMNQVFSLEDTHQIVSWQFNREFYCIVDHDEEVSCAGLLFYNSKETLFLNPGGEELAKIELLLSVFQDEYETKDNIQGEMLRMLLKRLIIKLTRYFKDTSTVSNEQDLNLFRKYNLLVEKNFRELHQVQDYADLLNKAPKTISNAFSQVASKRPIQIIHDRLALEAKRLLTYTDQTTKEISFNLGFREVQHFSRFFKKNVGISPTEFRNNLTVS